MQVFKFGGASVKDANSIRNVGNIVEQHKYIPLLLVVSAMGKNTNALEKVVAAHFNPAEDALMLLERIREEHYQTADQLLNKDRWASVYSEMDGLIAGAERYLKRTSKADYNFIYDQIVSLGELLSTKLVEAYLRHIGINSHWVDVRSCIRTNNTYREGKIDWDTTTEQINHKVLPLVQSGTIVVTQGFLGGTIEFLTTTLGREGSDYTAAVFSNVLNAECMSVWKDVPGILSGDPRIIPNVVQIPRLSYLEAIEMTYYGAKVIHPKTIKPIQNKNIPLRVRSFLDIAEEGTIIGAASKEDVQLPPVIVINNKQVLLKISTKDFSFIQEEYLSNIYRLFAKYRLKVNLCQNAAVSFSACVDNVDYKIKPLLADLGQWYNIEVTTNLKLKTIRHYTSVAVKEHTKNCEIILAQKSANTVRYVVKEGEEVHN